MDKTKILNWQSSLTEELEKPYFKLLEERLSSARINGTVYPVDDLVFAAFDYCKWDDLKVVILGQDPYHGPGQANGLAFSVNHGISIPPSLRNIFKELDLEKISSQLIDGNLELWAKQGVLLLNTVLTVEQSKANSHTDLGWQEFTDAIIKLISSKKENVIFLLWGGKAKLKTKLIDTSKHYILEAGHPSPLSANRGHWFNNQHFNKVNEILSKQGEKEIKW
ncbi:MAG: uracil-DNA glycosylase [Flavobacteriaceae bacterium]